MTSFVKVRDMEMNLKAGIKYCSDYIWMRSERYCALFRIHSVVGYNAYGQSNKHKLNG